LWGRSQASPGTSRAVRTLHPAGFGPGLMAPWASLAGGDSWDRMPPSRAPEGTWLVCAARVPGATRLVTQRWARRAEGHRGWGAGGQLAWTPLSDAGCVVGGDRPSSTDGQLCHCDHKQPCLRLSCLGLFGLEGQTDMCLTHGTHSPDGAAERPGGSRCPTLTPCLPGHHLPAGLLRPWLS
jgi:hypothetical protein